MQKINKEPSKCIECKLVVGGKSHISKSTWCRVTTQSCENPYKCKNKNCPLELISNKEIG
jgi:hypothetical protein